MAFFTRLLNAVGLHTQAELDAARATGLAGESSTQDVRKTVDRSQAPQRSLEEEGFANDEARRIFERATEDFDHLPIAMQVQAKSQAIEKMRALVIKGRLDVSEFERWKRRLLML